MQGDGQTKLVLCGCGKLHVTYGSVTLHFEREEFVLFAESIGRLAAMLKQSALNHALALKPTSNVHICH
ncbi:MAG: hypothetical protein GDA67_14300 [Nitrospira sp. CR1.3]|nr:hypothetical protein [Nitrospira sp. CR1.3]